MRKYRFEIWRSKDIRLWFFHFKAPNNEIMFSSEGYKSLAGAKRAIRAIRREMWLAKVIVK